MKKLFTILAALIITLGLFAQAPLRMSYQAVIRNSSNNLVSSHIVGMKVSILQGDANGASVYAETQTITTNTNGLATIEIGGGIPVTGTFGSINWANGPYFIKTETDQAGGTNYTISGTSQLLSVPYALHAKIAESVSGGIIESDPIFGAWNKSTGISITALQVSDFQSGVTNNTSVLANTAKNSYPAVDAAKLAAITGINTGDQDLNGKEDKTNKITSISATSTNVQYPSAKLTYDQLALKVDKVTGKGLSTNDYTTAEQIKVSNLSGTNTGDNATNSQYSGLVTNATHTGEVTGSNALTIDNAAVIGKVLTGYTSGAGTIVATDNILQAIQKLNGNDGGSNATHTGDATGATALTLATVNSNVGTFNNVTINAKGLATAASNVAYLTSETDPTVKAITGIVKSNGTTISAATAGTDYLTPSGSGASLTGITSIQVGAPSGSGTSTGTNTGDQTLPTLSGLGGVAGNTAITGATNTKITYDAKGLVTAGADATTADIAASTNKNYVTDAQQTVIGNTSGTNTGDQTLSGLGGVPTTRTVNGHALSSDVAVTVADVNLGNVTNESKTTMFNNPTFTGTTSGITAAMVSAPSGSGSSTGTNTGDDATNAQYSGLVTNATHTGDVTGSGALTIAANVVTDAKFRQGAARSIVGVTGNAIANTSDIQGAADQILRVNGAGTALAFGAVDLSKSAAIGTSILPVANGGTNANLSSTGGAGQYLKQISLGGAITVGAIDASDIPLITIPDASFTYSSSRYLQSDPNQSPHDYLTGGTFSSAPGGLSINPSTGTINLATSALGIYTISYTVTSANATYTKSISLDVTNINDNTNAPTYVADPSATIGLTAVNGTANSAMRSDGAPALDVSIAPTWTGTHTFSNGTYSALFTVGNVGIGTTTPNATLEVDGVSGTTIRIADGNQSAGYVLTSDGDGQGSWQAPAVSIGGSGTANYLPKWESATSLSSISNVYDDGTNVGIGTEFPSEKLDVVGSIQFTGALKVNGGNSGASGSVLTSTGTGAPTWAAVGIDVADEFATPSTGVTNTVDNGQTAFTLTYILSANRLVKMYINGVRISNTAYSISSGSKSLTYIPAKNGSYAILATDRIQFDYIGQIPTE